MHAKVTRVDRLYASKVANRFSMASHRGDLAVPNQIVLEFGRKSHPTSIGLNYIYEIHYSYTALARVH